MLNIRFVLLCVAAILPVTLGQDVAAALLAYPECARGCITDAFMQAYCVPTNQTCICTDEDFQFSVTSCVVTSCTIPDSLATKNVSATNCGAPVRNRSSQHVVISITLAVMAALFVLIRFGYKLFFIQMDLGLDDWLVLACLAATIPSAFITIAGTTKHGLGMDIWAVAPEDITKVLRYFYLMAWLYFLQGTLVKLSIISFYLRIFPSRGTQRLLWGTFWFTSAWGTVFILVAIFQCKPIHYFWTKWDGMHEGQCLQANSIAWSNAIINIVLDLWILAIPLWELRSLQLHWKKKVGVALMFGVGTFVTVVSILRLQSLVHFAATSNSTWEFYDVSIWSTIEICVGIMCACLPTVRLLLVKIFPILAGTSRRATEYYQRYGGSESQSKSAGGKSRNEAVVTVDRPDSKASAPSSSDSPRGIIYHKTYTVQYSENDETSLVRMITLDKKGRK